jgi:hypothetical protein
MRKIILFSLLLAFMGNAYAQVSFGEPQLINSGWKFQKGDVPEAAQPEFADNRWRTLDLPHDWSVESPLSTAFASATGYLPGGIGWYRKSLEIPASRAGQKVYIYFEGVYRNGEIFINGSPLGMRPSGYASYMYELTPYIRFGEKNILSVRVDHTKFNDSRWYTGSGIYRDVYLVYANPVHIAQWGVYITTPEVTPKQATIQIETTVENTTQAATSVTITQEVLGEGDKVLASGSGKISLDASNTHTLVQSMKLKQPMLWSTQTPNMYRLRTRIMVAGKVVDQTLQKFGIRTLKFDANKGFFLNGTSMKVKGVCIHHDAGVLGAAVPAEIWKLRLKALKELGCNAIRTSHNPQAPILYDLCDELGLLVMNEAFDEWEFAKKKWVEGWNAGTPTFDGTFEYFEEWGETDLRDMVRRDRNHPSVFMWSIGNEVDYPNDPYSHPVLDKEGIGQQAVKGYLPNQPHADRLGGIAKRLAAVVRQVDPSRPVTAGLAGPVMSNETEYPGALDVVGYNYTENRYAQDHATYPDRIFYGSETNHAMSAWKAVRDQEYIFGQFLWTGIDYLGEAYAWPSRGFVSGLLDLTGFKKPRAWFRESLWSDKPMAYLGTSISRGTRGGLSMDALPQWNYEQGTNVRVVCYTNCQQAQLLLNGQKIGEPKPYDDQNGIISWDLPYQPGKLEVIGLNNGQEAARYALQTSKQPHAIKARILNPEDNIVQIDLQIVDEDNKPVLLSDNEITCSVTGSARLMGMEASNPTDMGDYRDNRQRVYNGRLSVYIRKGTTSENSTISFSAQWLKGTSVELSAAH